jgi:hypothetical protein
MRGRRTIVAALVILAVTPTQARKHRDVNLALRGDLCNLFCQVALCAGSGPRPDVTACDPAHADLVVQLPPQSQIDVTIDIRRTRVHMRCLPPMLPCFTTCTTDADCALNGPSSRCVDGTCLAKLGCD